MVRYRKNPLKPKISSSDTNMDSPLITPAITFCAGALATLLLLRATQKKTSTTPSTTWKEDLERLIDNNSTESTSKESCSLTSLRTPALLLYLDVARRNASVMLQRASDLQCTLRPHVKTHKTLQGAYLQTGGTCKSIVCSTLAEARHNQKGGFDDILYAVPITPDKLNEAAVLTNQAKTCFSIMVDHPFQLNAILNSPPPSLTKKWSIVLMVDCGYGRDGVLPNDPKAIQMVLDIAQSATCEFCGIYTHGGHSYASNSSESIRKVACEERDAGKFLKSF